MRLGRGAGSQAWGVLLVNLATLAWASNAVLGRWLRDDIGPLTLTALRFSVAEAWFAWLLSRHEPAERRLDPDGWWLLAMGLCGVAVFSPLLYLGLHHFTFTAVNSSLFQGFSPLITAMLAGVMTAEPVSRRQKAGALLGLMGVLGLVSATALSTLLALPLLLVAGLVELYYVPFHLRPHTLAAVAHICVVPTILGYWCWNQAVQILGAGGAMAFYNTLPLYGALLGALALGEPLTLTHLVCGGLIVAGGLWGTLGGGTPWLAARGRR